MARPQKTDAPRAEAKPDVRSDAEAAGPAEEAPAQALPGLHDVVSSAALKALAESDYHAHAALHGLEALLGEVRYRAQGLKASLPNHSDLLDRILSAV